MDQLVNYRSEFPILESTTYLINHSLGAMPRGVEERMAVFTRMWGERGIRSWGEGWWEMPLTVGNRLARIMGAPEGSVVMHPNVSVCQSLILSAFDLRGRRNKIVYEALNFPSVKYVYQRHAAEAGAEIVEVPSDDGIVVETQRMVEAIDERTLLVPISHVLFRSGYLQEVAAIVEKAHRVGALVVLDVYQSVGTVPFDLTALGVDFATGGSVKWLCGGPGAGFLYVRPDLVSGLRPAATGWAAHRDPFSFAETIDYAADHHRFLNGTPVIPALYAAEPGYALIEEVGVPRIRERSIELTSFLISLGEARGWRLRSPRAPQARGGSVIFDLPQADQVVRLLAERQILVDYRPGAGMRVGPHFFNTREEIATLVEAIDEIHAGPLARASQAI
jgi:kynureninase